MRSLPQQTGVQITPWLLCVFLVTTSRGLCASGSEYVVSDLGTLGGAASAAGAINNRGDIVGEADVDTNVPPTRHPFLWRQGLMTDLGTLGGPLGAATALNEQGQVVGWAMTRIELGGQQHAFLYIEGVMTDLGTLGGMSSKAYAINNQGQVVGTANNAGEVPRAFLHSAGTMADIGTPGGTPSGAESINDSGQIAGYFVTNLCVCNNNTTAFLSSGGTITDLGALGTLGSLRPAVATAINQWGQAVGWANNNSVTLAHGYLYSGGVFTDLGTLSGALTNSQASALNHQGEVVGRAGGVTGSYHAFLYRSGTMHDLNILVGPYSGWTLQAATGLNDNGQIVGYGLNPVGQRRAFLLTPRPRLQNIQLAAGAIQFELVGVTGLTYRVEYAPSLSPGPWFALTNFVLSASPRRITDSGASPAAQRFYRAVQTP